MKSISYNKLRKHILYTHKSTHFIYTLIHYIFRNNFSSLLIINTRIVTTERSYNKSEINALHP